MRKQQDHSTASDVTRGLNQGGRA